MYLYAPLLLVALLILLTLAGILIDVHDATDEFMRDYYTKRGDGDGEE